MDLRCCARRQSGCRPGRSARRCSTRSGGSDGVRVSGARRGTGIGVARDPALVVQVGAVLDGGIVPASGPLAGVVVDPVWVVRPRARPASGGEIQGAGVADRSRDRPDPARIVLLGRNSAAEQDRRGRDEHDSMHRAPTQAGKAGRGASSDPMRAPRDRQSIAPDGTGRAARCVGRTTRTVSPRLTRARSERRASRRTHSAWAGRVSGSMAISRPSMALQVEVPPPPPDRRRFAIDRGFSALRLRSSRGRPPSPGSARGGRPPRSPPPGPRPRSPGAPRPRRGGGARPPGECPRASRRGAPAP